jgi:general stress protein YciG
MARNKNRNNDDSMSTSEAGRLGGEKVASERGPEFYEEIGSEGGQNSGGGNNGGGNSGGGSNGGGGQSNNPGNFANDRDKAREAGREGGSR